MICLVCFIYLSPILSKGIADVAKKLGASIKATGFIRYAKGEGIEKKEENYAEEIAKMTGNK